VQNDMCFGRVTAEGGTPPRYLAPPSSG
jgi:hypothetical protein